MLRSEAIISLPVDLLRWEPSLGFISIGSCRVIPFRSRVYLFYLESSSLALLSGKLSSLLFSCVELKIVSKFSGITSWNLSAATLFPVSSLIEVLRLIVAEPVPKMGNPILELKNEEDP